MGIIYQNSFDPTLQAPITHTRIPSNFVTAVTIGIFDREPQKMWYSGSFCMDNQTKFSVDADKTGTAEIFG